MTAEIKGFKNINRNRWNEFLSKSVIADVFQTYEWVECCKKSFNVNPKFFVVYSNDMMVGCQVFFEKNLLGLFKAYESKGGPIYLYGYEDQVICSIINFLTKHNYFALYKSIQPQAPHNFEHYFVKKDFFIDKSGTFIIDITIPIETLWKNLNKNAKWGVKRAKKEKVKVIEATKWEEWQVYYDMHTEHTLSKGFASIPQSFFKNIFKILYPKKMAKLFMAEYNREYIAGMLFLLYRDYMVFYQNASVPGFLKLQPNDLLLWSAIEWAKSNNIKTFDLGGAIADTNKNSYLYGIYKFKEKWGGKYVEKNIYSYGKLYHIGRTLVFNNPIVRKLFYFLKRKRLM